MMSDGATHFRIETAVLQIKALHVPHNISLLYCPWINWALERLVKELLMVFRAVLFKLQQQRDHWPSIVTLVQSALSNSPSPHWCDRAPITIINRRSMSTPINTILRGDKPKPLTLVELQSKKVLNNHKLMEDMNALHLGVYAALVNHCEWVHHNTLKVKPINFEKDDYVLMARNGLAVGEKQCLQWRGSRHVVKAFSGYVFLTEDLWAGILQDVRGTRLKFNKDSRLNTWAILSHVLASEMGMPVARPLRLVKDKDS